MSFSVSPLRGLGMKCQLRRSLSVNAKPAVSSCSGDSESRKRLALAAISDDALATSAAGASARTGDDVHACIETTHNVTIKWRNWMRFMIGLLLQCDSRNPQRSPALSYS